MILGLVWCVWWVVRASLYMKEQGGEVHVRIEGMSRGSCLSLSKRLRDTCICHSSPSLSLSESPETLILCNAGYNGCIIHSSTWWGPTSANRLEQILSHWSFGEKKLNSMKDWWNIAWTYGSLPIGDSTISVTLPPLKNQKRKVTPALDSSELGKLQNQKKS